jgi:arylsulfatase A-like enzyme
MGRLRAAGRRILRLAGTGPGAGAIALSLLFGVDLLTASLEFMGYSDEKATSVIVHRYGARIVANQLAILLSYAVIGAAFGAMGEGIGRLWDWSRRKTTTRARRVGYGLFGVVAGHLYAIVRSLVHYPQLYTEAMYDHGGLRRKLMVFLTDHLSLPLIDVVFWLGLAALLVVPLSRPRLRDQIARLAATRWTRWMVGAAVVLVAVGAVGLARRPKATARGDQQPNVLILAVDSLRADRVFAPDAALRFPTLARMAANGIRFREAHVTVPRTFPSFVTLLTGRFPHHHGIRHMFPTAEARKSIGPALPAAFAKAGYRTAVVSDYAGEIFSRTPLGFEVTDTPYFDMKTIIAQRGLEVHPNVLPYATSRLGRRLFPALEALADHSDPDILAERAIEQLDSWQPRPFFLTVFFSTAHFPYAAPAPYYKRFASGGYDGPYRYQKPPLAPAPQNDLDASQIRALYDGAVAATDAAVERVLRKLERSGLAKNTIVVLLADHGENLYDQPERGMGHGDHLRGDAADHVPVVVIDPIHHPAPHDVMGIVRDVDVAPTLAALAGIQGPPTDGTSLVPLLRGERDSLDLDAFTETEFWFTDSGPGFGPNDRLPYPGITGATDLAADDDIFIKPEWQDLIVVAKHRAIRSGSWKAIYEPTRDGVKWSLFDVAHDRAELHDVSAEHVDVLASLRRKLEAWMTSDGRTTLRGGFAVPQ